MYGKGNIVSLSTTGIGGTAGILGGFAVLPNTSSNHALLVLGIATATIGVITFLSFVATRLAIRLLRK